MKIFITTLVSCSISMTIIGMIIISITFLIKEKYKSKWFYHIWVFIVLGLAIPFRPYWGKFLIPITNSNDMLIQLVNGDKNNLGIVNNTQIVATKIYQINNHLYLFIFITWLIGAIIIIIYSLLKHMNFLFIIKRWNEPIKDKEKIHIFKNIKKELGILSNIKLYMCPLIKSPMIIGIINSTILLPPIDYTTPEIALILKHELVHFKRKDLWVKILVIIAMAIHWFNPFIYLLPSIVSWNCELSCDEKILHKKDIKVRLTYFDALVKTIKSQSKLKTSLSYNFFERRKGMEYRLLSILNTKQKKNGKYIILILLPIILSTGVLVGCDKNISTVQPTRELNKTVSNTQPKSKNNSKTDFYSKSILKTYKSFEDFQKKAILEIPYSEQKYGTTYSGTLKFAEGHVINTTNKFVATYQGIIKIR